MDKEIVVALITAAGAVAAALITASAMRNQKQTSDRVNELSRSQPSPKRELQPSQEEAVAEVLRSIIAAILIAALVVLLLGSVLGFRWP